MAAENFRPELGHKGLLRFTPGITVPDNVPLVVSSATPIQEMKLMGVDLEHHYERINCDTLVEDLRKGVIVYRLASENDSWYVPETALLSLPSVSYVGYQNYVLGVEFGELPSDEPFEDLEDSIKHLIEAQCGVIPKQVKVMVLGDEVAKTEKEHKDLQTARRNLMQYSETLAGKHQRTVYQLNEANKTIRALEKVIEGLIQK